MEFSPAAARAFRKLPAEVRSRLSAALRSLAEQAGEPGRISGKRVKTIKGTGDTFHRLRVDDYRVMYDVIAEDRVLLVLGIVHRGELETWLRSR
ncbi:MAG: type II toxin-antitoxin system RelE/ParE family toxin [Actinobacteria bacterium]|nr:type II toxin-antitoxin system RelE/ParE family toxin [Actinomycetota bacterium]